MAERQAICHQPESIIYEHCFKIYLRGKVRQRDFFVLFLLFGTGSYYVVLGGLELAM